MNICGCVAHLAPLYRDSAQSALAAIEGVEIHAKSEDGRYVVVVEDTADKPASDIIMAIHQIPGIVSLTLNYHHFEPEHAVDAQANP